MLLLCCLIKRAEYTYYARNELVKVINKWICNFNILIFVKDVDFDDPTKTVLMIEKIITPIKVN